MNDQLDQAFEALNTYDWGQDTKLLQPIEAAIIASHGNDPERKQLETRLAAVLGSDAPYDAKQYACRKLRVIGSPSSVPALAALLTDAKLSHMARFALERMPAKQAGDALRDALAKVGGDLRIGMITSLGVRGEADSVGPLQKLLGDKDAATVRAAAYALAEIGTPEASNALAGAKPTDATETAIADASLACAEKLLAQGNKTAALKTYKRLLSDEPTKLVRLAATRGMLACTGK